MIIIMIIMITIIIHLHSAKGVAVETGCSDLNGVIYYVTISY